VVVVVVVEVVVVVMVMVVVDEVVVIEAIHVAEVEEVVVEIIIIIVVVQAIIAINVALVSRVVAINYYRRSIIKRTLVEVVNFPLTLMHPNAPFFNTSKTLTRRRHRPPHIDPYLNRMSGRSMEIYESMVPKELQGQGIAAALCQSAFEYAQAERFRVIPSCSYVRDTFLPKFPTWKNLVGDGSGAPSSSSSSSSSSSRDTGRGGHRRGADSDTEEREREAVAADNDGSPPRKARRRSRSRSPQRESKQRHDNSDHNNNNNNNKDGGTTSSTSTSTTPSTTSTVNPSTAPPGYAPLPHHPVLHRGRTWANVATLLSKRITDAEHLSTVILTLNNKNAELRQSMPSLRHFINVTLTREERHRFFHTTLPFIQRLVLDIPSLFKETSIPLLLQQKEKTIDLSRRQVASIIAAAFFSLHATHLPNKGGLLFMPLSVAHLCLFALLSCVLTDSWCEALCQD
jgi:predicted GNAT family acetyltransferase